MLRIDAIINILTNGVLQTYNASFPKIPVACITVEDAELLQRYYDRSKIQEHLPHS